MWNLTNLELRQKNVRIFPELTRVQRMFLQQKQLKVKRKSFFQKYYMIFRVDKKSHVFFLNWPESKECFCNKSDRNRGEKNLTSMTDCNILIFAFGRGDCCRCQQYSKSVRSQITETDPRALKCVTSRVSKFKAEALQHIENTLSKFWPDFLLWHFLKY